MISARSARTALAKVRIETVSPETMTHAAARLSLLVQLRPSDRATAGAMALAAARNGRVTAASAAPHPQRLAQPLLHHAALHHGGEQLARAQRAYEPSSLGAAGAPPLGSAQRRRVPAPASHPQQRWQRCCGLLCALANLEVSVLPVFCVGRKRPHPSVLMR